MIRVKNHKAVKNISKKSLKANYVRNLVAVFAVMLTTMLFMALFTIAGTMVYTFQQETFRQVGGSGHGSFKDLTLEQKETLEKDPLIKEAGGRLMLGMASGEHFRKVHAELSYMEPVYQRSAFCEPEHGKTPKEGTKELACDTRVLKALGIGLETGAEVTMAYEIGGTQKTEITDTFVLSGWWEYDPACAASMAIVPKSYVEGILKDYPQDRDDASNYTGLWDLGVFLGSSLHIEDDLKKILQNHGFQTDNRSQENYIAVGVNWAYAGAQLAQSMDPAMLFGIAAMLFLILLTGYLIIYNIFQISVSGDIRFYGLLKTVGTTGRQIKRIIRRQALLLCVAGIPAGLVFGSLVGTVLAPVILSTYNTSKTYGTISPWFFVAAAAFSLVTVLISCAKPGRFAAKVSPVEAVRYTDAAAGGKKKRTRGTAKLRRMAASDKGRASTGRSRAGAKPLSMAIANFSRNKKKTVLVVLSMTLAVVLLQVTYMFAKGFDMDKYLKKWVVSDFIVGDAAYFRPGMASPTALPSVPQEDIENLEKAGQITKSGRIYGHVWDISTYVPEEIVRKTWGAWMPQEDLEMRLEAQKRDDAGNVCEQIDVYGMEDYPLSQLEVLEGDLADLYDPDKNAVAAVYTVDDYDEPIESSQWAHTGDTVTVHYTYGWEYRDSKTGEVIPEEAWEGYDGEATLEETDCADITYEVVACVTVKHAMSYRSFGSFPYVMNAQVFKRDSRTSDVMIYLFNTTPENNASMQAYLEEYTNGTNPNLDFESKQRYVQEFEEYRNMFLLMGSVLSFVVGLVGILNFLNAVLTSIHARRLEFAMLQSIGMTGRQLKKMLICEGLIYGVLAVMASLALSFAFMPVMEHVAGGMFWFFTYRFTVLPVLMVIPVFAALGALLPLLCYRSVARQTVVERLRESE